MPSRLSLVMPPLVLARRAMPITRTASAPRRGQAPTPGNAAGQLASSDVSGTITTYGYNGDGTRASSTTSGTTTTYVFDLNNPCSPAGAGVPVGQRDRSVCLRRRASHVDAHGRSRLLRLPRRPRLDRRTDLRQWRHRCRLHLRPLRQHPLAQPAIAVVTGGSSCARTSIHPRRWRIL